MYHYFRKKLHHSHINLPPNEWLFFLYEVLKNYMKFGIRTPSLNKRIAARTSLKRYVRYNLGVKVPKGMGWIINSKKATYNKVYNKTYKGCMTFLPCSLDIN
jgi:hypothetical protein